MSCLILTPEIKELAKKIPGESEQSVLNLVGIWQSKNNKSLEDLPSVSEINSLIKELRENPTNQTNYGRERQGSEPITPTMERLGIRTTEDVLGRMQRLFDPITREDRVSLIARLFSNEVTELLRIREEELREAIANSDEVRRVALEEQLKNTNRMSIINELTPAGIYKRIYDMFKQYVNSIESDRISTEENRIISEELSLVEAGEMGESERMSPEDRKALATRRAAHKYQEYRKLTDDIRVFKALTEETISTLKITENVVIDVNTEEATDNFDYTDAVTDEVNESEMQADDYNKEESVKDGWMVNFREVSPTESLSAKVRKALSTIYKLDSEGYYEEDDLGNERYLDAYYTYRTLMNTLTNMLEPSDLIPMLEKLSQTRPWVSEVIERLQEDEELFSQFYQAFRKDQVNYWIQKRVANGNGTFTFKTSFANKSTGFRYMLTSWRYNHEGKTKLDKESVYGVDKEVSVKNAQSGQKWADIITNALLQRKRDRTSIDDIVHSEKALRTIEKMLHMVGVDFDPNILRDTLENDASGDNFKNIVGYLSNIFSGISKGRWSEDDNRDFINAFTRDFEGIAAILNDPGMVSIEDTLVETFDRKTKTFYSYTKPSYLGKLIKNLKNVYKDKKRFMEYIQKEFKDYPWFFTKNRWLNYWLKELEESQAARDLLDHKVVLHSGKVGYMNMDDLDYTLTIINEFFSDPTGETAWYHVPILADANSAEFIRFKRISGTNYESEIIKHLEDVVIQEYNRITEVIERDKKIQNGTANFDPIANFDISRNPDGSIKNIGGAEFKFFPALNNIKYEDGETFAKKMHKFVTTGNTESLKKLLNTTLTALLDEQFEEAFSNWVEKGVLDEVEGKYKYLSGSIGSTGQSSTDNRIAKAMESAKKVLGDSWTDYHEDLLNAYKNHETYPTRTAQGIISELRGMIEDRASRGIISNSLKNSIVQNLKYANFAKEKLREYFYNSKLATSQIIELTSTDLAYYKNYVEFQKRNKEIHGSTDKLNTLATYKGERVGRENERTIYLRDDKVASNVVEDIYEIVMQKLAKKELNELSAATMLSKYGYSNYSIKDKFGKEVPYVKIGHTLVKTDAVNISDAQAYRSLSSYRSVMIMSGKWSEESERAYNNIRNNKWNMEDINVVFQTLKPFVYAQTRKFSYYEKQRVPKVDSKTGEQVLDSLGNPVFEMIDDTSRPVYRKVSTQHKNSEFLLLAMYDAVSGPLGKSPKLRAINKFMEDHQIDVVQFESAVKVGGQGIIDLSGVETEEDVIAKLEADTGIKSGVENPNVVHSIPYSDYGIQQGTPEHAIDAVQLVGTQGRKIIAADFPENIEFNVNGNKLSREEWLKLYNSVITENILESFIQIDKKFRDIKEVEKELQNAIKRSNRYGIEVQRALTLNEDNQFTVPPYDSVVSTQVQSLVNSIIRSHVTKQKIKGGGAYQVSAYGLSDQLNIVFEGEGENKRIKYVECFMPMYSKELFEPLIDPKTGTIDMSKLPEDLRKAIGYRLPTENKYSILPLRIKGFLPQENGSSIMLPVEITTIMGSDFDIDKMYLYFPEFDIQRYNMRKAREDFAKMNAVFNNILSNFTHSQLAEDFLEDDTDDFKEWFNENKEKYRLSTPRLKKVKYDMSKAPEGNNRRARNNMFIDMIYSVLTHPVMASRVLTPGNYDSQKRAERIITIIKNVTEKDLRNHLNSLGIKYGEDVISTLSNLDINTLTEISESLKPVADPLSPLTQVFFHQQNMVGLKSITVYANHNANHALMQHTKLAIKPEHAFVLNGKKYTSLHDIYNDEGGLISDSLGGYLAASVDNAKDPILATLNQNMFTIGCSMLLARLKHEPITVGLLMNQPIVEDMIAAYSSGVREGKTKEQIINEVLAKYKEAASGVFDLSGLADSYQFLNKDLAHNIIIASNLQNASEAERLSLQRSQLAIGELFAKIMASAEALDRVVAATRSDTGNGGVGSSIAETEAKIAKIQDTMYDAEENSKFPLEGANVIDAYTADFDTSTPEGIERLREFLLNSQLPYLQAFYTLGLLKTRDVLRRYFPFYTEGFKDSVSLITSFSKKSVLDGGTRKAIYQDLIAYILSKTPFFGTEYSSTDPSEVVESTEEKRSRIIKEFPKTFSKVIAENPDIANVEFISNLKVINANKDNPVPTIVLANSGRLSKIIKERYGRDWASLLYSENPIAQRLALDLALYSYFKNGLGFGPNSFGYILPLEVRMNIPGYIDTLRSIMDSEDSYREFADQFMYNHLEDGKLIPTVPVQASQFSFIDDKGKAKNIVEISFPETPSFADRKFIKHSIGEAEGRYIPFSYVRVPVNRKDTYYRVFMTENGFVYKRIRPLGFHNSFIEYEYGTDVEAMHSSLRKDIKYDENEVLSGQANNDESSTDIDSTLLPKETPITDEEAAALAYEEIFHKTYETDIPKVDDIDAIEPKEDFRDADGNPICK